MSRSWVRVPLEAQKILQKMGEKFYPPVPEYWLDFCCENINTKTGILKKIVLIFSFSFILYACEKDNLIPDKEVPEWLKAKISQDEQIIKDSPQLMNAYGAWMRYSWQNEYFFEYYNELSSSGPRAISTKGDTLHIYVNDINTDYYKEKCCRQYVWKAPHYSGFTGK
jgi:hypothetical protein